MVERRRDQQRTRTDQEQRPPRGTLRPEELKRNNMGRLLTRVHLRGPTSRATLTRDLGLNRSTIGDLTTSLVDLGLVIESGTVSARGNGRPSYVVQPRDDVTVIAVNLGVDREHGGQHRPRWRGAVPPRAPAPPRRARHAERRGVTRADDPGRAAGGGRPALRGHRSRRAGGRCPARRQRHVRAQPRVGGRTFLRGAVLRLGLPVVCDNDANLGARAETCAGSPWGATTSPSCPAASVSVAASSSVASH